MLMIRYLSQLPKGKIVLWCYLIWYFVTVFFHFDASPSIWLNSLGISLVIGYGLLLSVASPDGKRAADRWQVARLFLMPFCVSSFSSLIKGQGFLLIISPDPFERAVSVACCLTFVAVVALLKARRLKNKAA